MILLWAGLRMSDSMSQRVAARYRQARSGPQVQKEVAAFRSRMNTLLFGVYAKARKSFVKTVAKEMSNAAEAVFAKYEKRLENAQGVEIE